MRKLLVISISILCFNGLLAQTSQQKAEYKEKVAELINSRNYVIDIMNVYKDDYTFVEVYSYHSLRIMDDFINVDFPYFVRNDDYKASLATDNIKLSTQIDEYKIKKKSKKNDWEINIIAADTKGAKYDIILKVSYDGYCTILVKNPDKQKVMYDGRLRVITKQVD
jgi:hypothetical protein